MLGKHIVRWDTHCEHCNNELINSSLTDQAAKTKTQSSRKNKNTKQNNNNNNKKKNNQLINLSLSDQ